MTKNIIQVLKAGNQELFYSAFFAWLLDSYAEHGLTDQFSTWFFEKIGEQFDDFEVATEKQVKGGRADILITKNDGCKIVVENKTKSMGSIEQIKAYEDSKIKVVPLGFVKENFPTPLRERVVTYSDVLSFLKTAIRVDQRLSVVVDEFISYLDFVLSPFDVLNSFCLEEITIEIARAELEKRGQGQTFSENDNDRRFFQAIYFERLLTFMASNDPNLIFGDSADYYFDNKSFEKPLATKWIVQKNLQGNAFMEAIVYAREIPGKLMLSDKWNSMLANNNTLDVIDMSPRLELYGSSNDIFVKQEVGVFQLGCWDEELKKIFHASNQFKKRGSRNFHYKTLCVEDLKYGTMTNIIKAEMSKIWEFQN